MIDFCGGFSLKTLFRSDFLYGMKVYVTGSTLESRKAQAAVTQLGHTVTFDWTIFALGTDATPDDLARLSRLSMTAMRQADLVVVVFADTARVHQDTFADLGAAVALQKPVVILDLMGATGQSARSVPVFNDALTRRVYSYDELAVWCVS